MSQFIELYQKVAADAALQATFAEIMKQGEADGKEATESKLLAFAKSAGYEVTTEELRNFVEDSLQKEEDGTLSDAELDMVAGGKSGGGTAINVLASILGVGIFCAAMSALSNILDGNTCEEAFDKMAKG